MLVEFFFPYLQPETENGRTQIRARFIVRQAGHVIMQCLERSVYFVSWSLIVGGVLYFLRQVKAHTQYGRYVETSSPGMMVPAKVAWFTQELPSVLIPVLLLLTTDTLPGLGRGFLLWTFCLHYFQRNAVLEAFSQTSPHTLEREKKRELSEYGLLIRRLTFIYSLLNKGRPFPLFIMVSAFVFCSLNGFLQGHYMLHCARYDDAWHTDARFIGGLLLFFSGMAINIHSDHILRNLRKPGEINYKIPEGGMFEWVSGANFFGEILEWCGYPAATWSLPSFAFAFFTICSIGPRAYHHHRFYLEKFESYPKSRKAVIPFIL
ncbi:hypothetical protein QTP70_022843 [Hemibagrus guttatus]|uniref:3-oxo-5alpha-steroid 4-dehydrogenase (NADP(+)) n=1 Tax=Hemibagrus guttatus TaxID=175788 RepID=A0AAE0PZC6_9TELE|nr:hypothetical protein QTP70_022843 [Hemibagrus guttatus]